MSAPHYDAVVIGAGVSGLVACGYLAKAGKRVLLAEARNKLGGLCETAAFAEGFNAPLAAHAFYALDPHAVRDLRLSRHGLKFAVRDMPLVGLRHDGKHLVLPHDVHAAARSIAIHSRSDAEAWPRFRRELFALARAMRKLWWEESTLDRRTRDRLVLLRHQSTAAFLDSWFETDALKTTLAFNATTGGVSPLEPGSALTLLWRAAQEMCGLQGVVAVPKGGPGALVEALTAAAQAAGAEMRTGLTVSRLHTDDGGAISAVGFASGETIACRMVLSSLSRHRTLLDLASGVNTGFAEAEALERAKPRAGAAKLMLALSAMPALGGVTVPLSGRMILADLIETMAGAQAVARAGQLPDDLAMEIVIPSAAEPSLAPPGQHILSALIRPVPLDPPEGWAAFKIRLVERALVTLEHQFSGLVRHVTGVQMLTPADFLEICGAEDEAGGAVNAARVLAPWSTRVATPVRGLFLCGASAEPAGAVSGRAGRIAASMALTERQT